MELILMNDESFKKYKKKLFIASLIGFLIGIPAMAITLVVYYFTFFVLASPVVLIVLAFIGLGGLFAGDAFLIFFLFDIPDE
ncbi:MAG: hypothetical protein ACXQS8_09995 [Candidatus Helarchaeales archaeon]